ncbi:MAG: family 20 glycosylhydrolase [Candidatus Paracaedibacteraceae bacterium]|nr:family 20 glycosylhydrolase [Candidatus Paracaedibacteraceae bacterium]
MKIIFTFFFLLLSIENACFCKDQKADNVNVKIDSVHMGLMENDIAPSDFSLKIKFTNHGPSISNWHFGFYIAGAPLSKFKNGLQDFNPRIIRRICDSHNRCSSLKYEKACSLTNADLSQGYTAIHASENDLVLLSKETYTIELLHINQWGGESISYFPQNFFLLLNNINNKSKIEFDVYSLDTNLNSYKLIGYDQNKVDSIISTQIAKNWGKSKEKNKDEASIEVIPSPVKFNLKKEKCRFSEKNITVFNQFNKNDKIAKHIIKRLKNKTMLQTKNQKNLLSSTPIIIKQLKSPKIIKNNPEGYVLEIDTSKIIISAITEAGVYYALQTFTQLWTFAKKDFGVTVMPQMKIIDYPRFPYRGILLDTARHFFSVKEIKSFIDIMGAHKLNALHLHLSDDEGFRVGLPSYPSIEATGNRRKFGLVMGPMMLSQENLYPTYKGHDFVRANTDYRGTYSADDISEIVRYANLNQITVIPEIDFPAHARALIKSLPSIFVDPADVSEYLSLQGYWDDVLPVCTYNTNISVGEKFTNTVNNIINYIVKIFDNQTTVYANRNEISLGGDEVSPNAWTNSPSCKNNWSSLTALQKSHKFFAEIAKTNPQLMLSGWQQFVQTDSIDMGKDIVPAKQVGHVWVWSQSKIGIPEAIRLIENGFPTVLAFSDKTYFDLVYSPDVKESGFAWATSWSDTYTAFSIIEAANHILDNSKSFNKLLGLEGALWSEHIPSYDQLIYMALPKMAGLSEASWSPREFTVQKQRLNWQSLARRLGCGKQGFLAYLNQSFGVQYRGYPRGIHLEVPKCICH